MKFDLAPLEQLEETLPKLAGAVERCSLGNMLVFACSRLPETERNCNVAEQVVSALPLVRTHLDSAVRAGLIDRGKQLWALGNKAGNATTAAQLDELARDLPQVTGWVEELKRFASSAWARRVDSEFEPARKLGHVLKEIAETPDLRYAAERMTESGAKGLRCRDALPITPEQQDRFQSLLKERVEAYELLQATGAEPEVVAFLQAVAEDRGTLAHLTQAVFDWLHRGGAGPRFKIGLS